jgi:hypothetical protein
MKRIVDHRPGSETKPKLIRETLRQLQTAEMQHVHVAAAGGLWPPLSPTEETCQ